MEDIYSIGEKWLKTVSSARSLTRSSWSSGRPEVPARAAAAAAVARKIAALPPHERLSLSTTSVYASRPRGEPVEELDQVFYEEGFDPVRHMLRDMPEEGVEQKYFDAKVGQKLLQLDVITERLSKQVMEHHEEMVKGMQLVTELDRDLQVASIICKNGRRYLSQAMHEVSQDLVVAANVRKKQILLDMVPVLERIQLSMDMKAQLDGRVEEGKYAKALQMCSECLLLLEECPELSAIQDMNHSIEEWLQRTIGKVDGLLMDVCRKFDVRKYTTVIDAYTLLDDVAGLADKVQSFFAQIVVSETHDVLKNLLFQGEDAQIAQKKSRLPYRDLCLQLPESKFRQFLCKTLEVLFDLMCSYYTMMTWQQHPKATEEMQVTADIVPPGDILRDRLLNGKHRRSGSYGDLVNNVKESRHVRTGSLSSEPSLAQISTSPLQATGIGSRLLTRSFSRKKSSADSLELCENGTTSTGELDLQSQGSREDSGEESGAGCSLSRREEIMITTVGRALEKGRKTVWELAARRVAALLSSDAICATSPHQFLQSLDWVNKFILAGEAFSGAEAASLRTQMGKQSEQYFGAFHCQNLEVLRMIMEKEMWQQLSSVALKSVNLAGLTGNGASLLGGTAPSNDVVSSQAGGGSVSSGAVPSGFADWLEKGNPFSERKVQSPSVVKGDEGDAVMANGVSRVENGAAKAEDEEDDENEDLLADFIDEESQLPGRLYHTFRKSSSVRDTKDNQGLGDEKGLVLTHSSVSMLRYMDKYARLTQLMQPIASEVFKGLCQLFELYIFSIYKTFGQREAFSGSRNHSDSNLLTARLRATLVRISQGLEEQRLKHAASTSSHTSPSNVGLTFGASNASNNSSVSSETAPTQSVYGGATIMMSASNLYALKERSVAAESLRCLSQMLKRSRPWLQAMLPQDSLASVEYFYARTVDAVPDLKEHIYKAVARMLLNIGGYVDRIASVRWELKDLGMEHNGYIDLLLGEYKQFSSKLVHGGLQKEMLDLLLEYGVDTLAETLVEGLSRVKRCNNEGRALMSLDLQVLINGLQHLAPPRLRSNLQIVETYIKAFYLPETEYLHWVRTHPEYTKGQVIGLINLVATANNWKRKTRVDLVDRIESGDL